MKFFISPTEICTFIVKNLDFIIDDKQRAQSSLSERKKSLVWARDEKQYISHSSDHERMSLPHSRLSFV